MEVVHSDDDGSPLPLPQAVLEVLAVMVTACVHLEYMSAVMED